MFSTLLRSRILRSIAPSGLLLPLGCSTSNTPADQGAQTAPSGGAQSSAQPRPSTSQAARPATEASAKTTSSAASPSAPCDKPQRQCFTHEQLVDMIKNPPQGGAIDSPPGEVRHASVLVGSEPSTCDGSGATVLVRGGDPSKAPWDKNGCLPFDRVENGCCNAASTGPTFEGGTCCYQFCSAGCCGRPLMVDGSVRVAPAAPRADWLARDLATVRARVEELDPETRSALAVAWTMDARLEHASVASFARFALDLLALGAPSELVAAAQAAALDEVRHARLCFEIASRLAGAPIGPGALNPSGALVWRSLETVASAAVLEGCIGETLAAIYAREAADRAGDAGVRSALERIADDEAAHAELAWRFVRWALDREQPGVRAAIFGAFEQGLTALPLPFAPSNRVRLDTCRAWGRLTQDDARAIGETAVTDVLLPCIGGLG